MVDEENIDSITPVPAATILLIRDGGNGLEVFMIERNNSMHFASALVFPGGLVDTEDSEGVFWDRCNGMDGLPRSEIALRVAGVRETFEESGVVLARRSNTDRVLEGAEAELIRKKYHTPLNAGDIRWRDVIEQEDLILCCDQLAYFAHWITPEGRPKRFDTHFFLARMPHRQHATHDGNESVHSLWVRPSKAIAAGERGDRNVMFPTRLNLELLDQSETVSEAMRSAFGREVITVLPTSRFIEGDSHRVMTIPEKAGYGAGKFLVKDDKVSPINN